MAENGSDAARNPDPTVASTEPRRPRTYGRLTTAIAVLALATAAYSLWRLDATRDRLDVVNDAARALEGDRALLQSELQALSARELETRRELTRRLDELTDTAKRVQELASSVESLRGRTEAPERAWSRAEALFLLELAQRRLALERDVDTAVAALEAADARLAALRDPSIQQVRRQIARELQALRSVRQPDLAGVVARLATAEEQAMRAGVKGIVPTQPAASQGELPENMLARAWTIAGRMLASLVVVRTVDEGAGRVVTEREALIRRQHLQLLLLAARTAASRHDGEGYRSALADAGRWLGEFFDLSDPVSQALLAELKALEPVDVEPPLPDISGSASELRRLTPAAQAPG